LEHYFLFLRPIVGATGEICRFAGEKSPESVGILYVRLTPTAAVRCHFPKNVAIFPTGPDFASYSKVAVTQAWHTGFERRACSN
jgi:hypothetical protein